MKIHTNYEASTATRAVQCLRRVQDIADKLAGQRVVYEDPKPGERTPPAGVVYPALVRSMIARVFADAEQEGLDRHASIALEAWALATVTLDGHPITERP